MTAATLARFYVFQAHLTNDQANAINAGQDNALWERYCRFTLGHKVGSASYVLAASSGLMRLGWTIDALTLEDVFAIGNGGQDAMGETTRHDKATSVSVGNVIIWHDGQKWTSALCASFGWDTTELTETGCRLMLRRVGITDEATLYPVEAMA